jgi:hypothetical protein
MSCKRCASDHLSAFNGEVAIHFPGWEGLDKPLVFAFPELMTCLDCGFVEFVLADPVIEQLRKGPFDAQLGAA